MGDAVERYVFCGCVSRRLPYLTTTIIMERRVNAVLNHTRALEPWGSELAFDSNYGVP